MLKPHLHDQRKDVVMWLLHVAAAEVINSHQLFQNFEDKGKMWNETQLHMPISENFIRYITACEHEAFRKSDVMNTRELLVSFSLLCKYQIRQLEDICKIVGNPCNNSSKVV